MDKDDINYMIGDYLLYKGRISEAQADKLIETLFKIKKKEHMNIPGNTYSASTERAPCQQFHQSYQPELFPAPFLHPCEYCLNRCCFCLA